MSRILAASILCAGLAGAQWHPADPPAAPQSGMPHLARGPRGEVYLSWIDPVGDAAHALRVARWTGTAWAAPETVAQGSRWFVNWADFPSVAALPDGSLLAHWLTRAPTAGKYGYGIRVARRAPGPAGRWTETTGMNLADTEDYAGFLSFAGSAAVYLAPPAAAPAAKPGAAHHDGHAEGHRKTLRYVRLDSAGAPVADLELDADVCSCCQTATAETPSGLLVAYRDHLPGEIRDISLVRYRDGRWSTPLPLHRDGWHINGCPTEGPSIGHSGALVGVSWITRAEEKSRLQWARSTDGGETFAAPVTVDDGNPLGRPQLIALNARELLLVWLERTATGAEVRLRRLGADGRLGRSLPIAPVPAARTTGLPRIALAGDRVLVAWREGQVRAGWIALGAIPAL